MRGVRRVSAVVVRPVVMGLLMASAGLLVPCSVARAHDGHHPEASAIEAAPVLVQGAWIRATVPGQTATGGFMTLRAQRDLTLVGFRSPAAPHAELHEMAMDGDVMRMRAVAQLPLPAGKDVALRPGGHHLMLMGLTQALPAGQDVTVELLLKDAQGKTVVQSVKVPVSGKMPAPQPGGASDGAHMHHH